MEITRSNRMNVTEQQNDEVSDRKWAISIKEVIQIFGREDQRLVNANKCSHWNILYSLVILASSVVLTSPIHLMPQHNAVESPEYWYEFMITTTMTFLLYLLLIAILRFKIFFSYLLILEVDTGHQGSSHDAKKYQYQEVTISRETKGH